MSFLTWRWDLPQKLQRSCSFESVGRATPVPPSGPHKVAPGPRPGSASLGARHARVLFALWARFLQSPDRGWPSVGVDGEGVAEPEDLEQARYRAPHADHREAPAEGPQAL